MALVSLPGDRRAFIGPDPWNSTTTLPSGPVQITLDAANEALTFIGHMQTSDGGSHTINTTGSSSIGWRNGTLVWASGTTVVKIGIGAVNTTTGPPARAANVADVITFDVNAAPVGGSGLITANSWITSVPTAGTKTIAPGDLVAISFQMTARGGTDAINVTGGPGLSVAGHRPAATSFLSSAYAALGMPPNAFVTFADGATGWLAGSQIGSGFSARFLTTGSTPIEAGQLFQLPFPVSIYGIYGWAAVAVGGDFDVVLYSNPLGTPVAQRTVSVDGNVIAVTTGRRFEVAFPTPYIVAPNQPIAAVIKPTTVNNITTYYKTLATTALRVTDPWGTSGYGVTRNAGAFADANFTLDHYYIGLIAGAFEHGVMPTYGPGII